MLLTINVLLLIAGGIFGQQFLKPDKTNTLPKAGYLMDKWWNHSPKQDLSADNWQKRQAPYVPQDQSLDPDAMKVASKQSELQSLLQQIYQAEAALRQAVNAVKANSIIRDLKVKMETGEVTRTQQVAAEAEQALEEATNKVRLLSSDLQAAQEAAAQAAMRAHTAQLQLSAHDQLMFTARQRVDALSAQMVSVQAELAAAQQLFTLTNSSQHLEAQARAGQMPFLDIDSGAAYPPEAYPPQPYMQDPNFAQRWPPPMPQVMPPYQSNLPSPEMGQRHQIPYLYS